MNLKTDNRTADAPPGSLHPVVIPRQRWEQLMKDDSLQLTPEEIKAGWHFCYEWDGLLIGSGMCEMKWCGCVTGKHDGKTNPTSQDEAV